MNYTTNLFKAVAELLGYVNDGHEVLNTEGNSLNEKQSIVKIQSSSDIDINSLINSKVDNDEENEEEDDISSVDVVMVFALELERNEALRALNVSAKEQQTTYFDLQKKYGFTFQKFKMHELQVVSVTQTRMGMAMASSLTTRAILAFNPKLVVMTGICAGRQEKVQIGDILIADQVYDYTAGKIVEEGKLLRPHTLACDDAIKQILITPEINKQTVNKLIRSKWIRDAIPVKQSDIHIKALGTGTSVVDNKQIFEDAIKSQDDLYGIDMEAYGVALSCDVLHTPWLVVKGVQDFADGNKNIDETNVREYAAFASAAVLEKIVPPFLA